MGIREGMGIDVVDGEVACKSGCVISLQIDNKNNKN